MKKLLTLVGGLLCLCASSQTTSTVNYTAATGAISNPERGFYKHTETHTGAYEPLSQSTLTGYRVNSNITLILRVFYLEKFVKGKISSTYLASMQTDFSRMRAAGIKCIVRFAYSDDNDNSHPQDATKAKILSHITQLTPILTANSDVIAVVQAGFIGAWGEWYYTDNFGMNPTAADYANRKAVVNAILTALPNKMVQMRTPELKQKTYLTTSALSLTQAYTNTNIARIGHHNDCFLASADDFGTYNNIATEYAYLEQETKYLPMGGETCAINAPRSKCTSAVIEMTKFHWSYLNLDYHEGVIGSFQSDNCFTEIQNRLGYRFELVNGVYPTAGIAGAAMPITLKIKNTGFAVPYNPRTAYIILKNTVTNIEYKVAMNANPRFWNPTTTATINESITLPATVLPGSYKLYLSLPDTDAGLSIRPEYSIRMANNNLWETTTGYNNLQHTINVTAASGRIADIAPKNNITIYPVPADNELVLEMEKISDIKISVLNSIGQTVHADPTKVSSDKITINTQDLSEGVYFISFEKNGERETKRILVSH